MHVEQRADRRHRDFVDIDAAGRQRAECQAIAARRDATEKQLALPRAERLERDAGQLFRIIVETRNLVLFEHGGAQRLKADRNVLDAFGAFLRGHDDFAARRRRGVGRRRLGFGRGLRHDRRAEQRGSRSAGQRPAAHHACGIPHETNPPEPFCRAATFIVVGAPIMTHMQRSAQLPCKRARF